MTVRELALGLYGAWRLAHFDPLGMGWFDRSEEGFWRSFQAAVFAAPGYAILVALVLRANPVAASLPRIIAIEGTAYIIGWVAFPLAAFYLTRLVDREPHYLGYIVAYNWASLLQTLLFVPIAVIAASGILPASLGSGLQLVAYLAVLAYSWFVTRAALQLGGLAAAGFVLVDRTIAYFLSAATDGMLGTLPVAPAT